MLETRHSRTLNRHVVRRKKSRFFRICTPLVLAALCSACGSSGAPPSQTTTASANAASEQQSLTTSTEKEQSPDALSAIVEPDTQPANGSELPDIMPDENNTPDAVTDSSPEVIMSEVSCSADQTSMQLRTLDLINKARSTSRNCGDESYPAARALSWNNTLATVASEHSNDMATHNFFAHTGSDGTSASSRVSSAGYNWRTVGENIAAGQATAMDAVNGWLDSPAHCRNLMNQQFSEVAVSCAEDNDTDFKRYWTNVLATPR